MAPMSHDVTFRLKNCSSSITPSKGCTGPAKPAAGCAMKNGESLVSGPITLMSVMSYRSPSR